MAPMPTMTARSGSCSRKGRGSSGAAELRLAGVTHVLADEPVPYREAAALERRRGCASLRRGPRPALRAFRHTSPPSPVAPGDGGISMSSTGLRSRARDVVLPGTGRDGPGTGASARVETLRETADRLRVRVDAPEAGVCRLVAHVLLPPGGPAWTGAPADPVGADGHLVGVRVPAGTHTVEIWVGAAQPMIAGGLLAVVGLAVMGRLRR